MPVSRRTILIALALLIAVGGAALWFAPDQRWLALGVTVGGLLCAIGLICTRPTTIDVPAESADMNELSDARRRELIRGTSMHLRDMRYRYSVRPDSTDLKTRRPFNRGINSLALGFLPIILTDNADDRQAPGFLAFVHDGHRWRGPGLPCPGPEDAAVKHARKCVSPLEEQ